MASSRHLTKSEMQVVLVLFIAGAFFVIYACSDRPHSPSSSPQSTQRETQAERKVTALEAEMDAGNFALDVGLERVLDVMGRAADTRERKGNERFFIYNMTDGSKVVFVMVPRGGEGTHRGLKLSYITAE